MVDALLEGRHLDVALLLQPQHGLQQRLPAKGVHHPLLIVLHSRRNVLEQFGQCADVVAVPAGVACRPATQCRLPM